MTSSATTTIKFIINVSRSKLNLRFYCYRPDYSLDSPVPRAISAEISIWRLSARHSKPAHIPCFSYVICKRRQPSNRKERKTTCLALFGTRFGPYWAGVEKQTHLFSSSFLLTTKKMSRIYVLQTLKEIRRKTFSFYFLRRRKNLRELDKELPILSSTFFTKNEILQWRKIIAARLRLESER